MNKRGAAFNTLCDDGWAGRLPRTLVTDRAISFGALLVWGGGVCMAGSWTGIRRHR